jgi:bifunctional DNA-binding transcriptional regulator/antitoxin component of YhaV-PrlF toxin-antitoxin module
MPLTEYISFKTVLQKGNRIQLPKLVRWKYKLEQDQVLKVSVTTLNVFGWETFYARMDKSGRITIPKLTRSLLESSARDKQSLTGAVIKVNIGPA